MFYKRAPASKLLFTAVLLVAAAHVCVLTLLRQSVLLSNILQLCAGLLPVVLSVFIARRKRDTYFRNAWLTLAVAFSVWSAAQAFFVTTLFRTHQAPGFPSAADFLWMLFAFPILLVTVVRRSWKRTEWVTWLDSAQSCLFFGVLYALVFSHPAILSESTAYDVQSAALILACALRFSGTKAGPERTLFRNVGLYLIIYGVFSSLGNRIQQAGLNRGNWSDLCWSMPPVCFCILVLFSKIDYTAASLRPMKTEARAPKFLHGLSALGLSVLSVCAALALFSRHELAGVAMLLSSFLLFAIRTTARESQLTEAHRTLEDSVYYDALTGLANRAAIMAELAAILDERASAPRAVGLVYIDLDRFKTVNDGLGHDFGDRLLVKVAEMLKLQIGSSDCIARLGGDEFAIIVNNTDEAQARTFARKVVELFQDPIPLEGRLLHLTASVGLAMCREDSSAEDLLREADCAMYAAKHSGKNREQSFDEGMMEKLKDTISLEVDLRHALDQESLAIYYQPIYSTNDLRIVGFEALSRWQHPLRGFVSPVQFIPLAEETGLIMKLGSQVLRESCRQVKVWNEKYGTNYFISVNVSARQFADSRLTEEIFAVLSETSLVPELLKLEITESVLLSGVEAVEAVLKRLRLSGIRIALDDFGTGYSSLSYLLGLPVDLVKIDRSFVSSFNEDPRRENVLWKIIELVKVLGKQVVAEGVETLAEKRGLQEMGCDFLQGYFLAKPMAAVQVEELVKPAGWTDAHMLSGMLTGLPLAEEACV